MIVNASGTPLFNHPTPRSLIHAMCPVGTIVRVCTNSSMPNEASNCASAQKWLCVDGGWICRMDDDGHANAEPIQLSGWKVFQCFVFQFFSRATLAFFHMFCNFFLFGVFFVHTHTQAELTYLPLKIL